MKKELKSKVSIVLFCFSFFINACKREQLELVDLQKHPGYKLKYDSTNNMLHLPDCKAIGFDYDAQTIHTEIAIHEEERGMIFEPVTRYKSDTLFLSYKKKDDPFATEKTACMCPIVLKYNINVGSRKINKVVFVTPERVKDCKVCNGLGLENN
jgi:hypothetical protein